MEENGLGRSLKSATLDENDEQGIELDVIATQLDSGMNNYQNGEVFEARTESPDGMRLLIMAPFAKAFNLTDDNLGVNEVPHIHSVPTMEEEILHFDADDSVNNDDGVQKQRVHEENGTDFVLSSPDVVLSINVPEEEGISDIHDDSTLSEGLHMQQIKMEEILFPDVKADNCFTNTIRKDEEGVEQIDIGVEIADMEEVLFQKQPRPDAPGIRMRDTNILLANVFQVKRTQKIN